MRILRYMLSAVALCISLVAVACNDTPEDEVQPAAKFTLSVESLTVAYERCVESVTITSDVEWGAYPQNDWIKLSPSGGVSGTSTLDITIEANTTGDVREGAIHFKSAAGRVELPIRQNYKVEAVTIADANFLAALVESYDVDGDGILSTKEASDIRKMECSGRGIKSMEELSTYFSELTYLDCSDNELTTLDLSQLTALEYLDCSGNRLSDIDISRLRRLVTFDCTDNDALHSIYVWFGFSAGEGYSKPAAAEYVEPQIAAPEGYELVWHDEFDTQDISAPSSQLWWFETGDNGWGNNELQDYVSGGMYNGQRIAEVSDGTLKITAQKIDGKVRSVRMNSVESWTYGYFEGRLKLPKGKGTWPAFWMLPKNFRAWPDDGEIDIMEHVGYHENYVSSSIHCKAYYHSIGTQKTNEIHIATATSEFHTYAVEWTSEYMKFYFDGELHFTFRNDGKGDRNTWPFDAPFYLKLNLAWGGNWGGAMGIDESCLPATYEIDYVRVFKKIE